MKTMTRTFINQAIRRSVERGLMICALSVMFSAPVVIFAEAADPHAGHQQQGKDIYYCPMHPQITSDRKGSCPICGMDLVKRKEEKKVEQPARDNSSAGFMITPGQQQLIGVSIGTAAVRPLVIELSAFGRVVVDEELFRAQKEYINSSLSSTYWNPARQKLLDLGMGETEISELKSRRWADEGLVATVPRTKTSYYRTPYEGTSWVYVSVYENEASLIKPGARVMMTSPAFPGETFSGEVFGVARIVDPANRTVRVRVRAQDKERQLHPEMFVTATVRVELGKRLSVPAEAVMDSGLHKIVYVVKDDNFAPREVSVGARAGGFVEIKDGLSGGEGVVTSGNFLVDSESKLKGF